MRRPASRSIQLTSIRDYCVVTEDVRWSAFSCCTTPPMRGSCPCPQRECAGGRIGPDVCAERSTRRVKAINNGLDEALARFAIRQLEETYPYLIVDAR